MVVIGAGLAGLTAAATAARDGREVVVVEDRLGVTMTEIIKDGDAAV